MSYSSITANNLNNINSGINNEIISNFDNIAGKLTLFTDISKSKQNKIEKTEILDRPVTPLEHDIKDSPTSLQELLFLLQRRISIIKDSLLTEEDQLSLLGIVESELSLLWPDLKNLVDYPLFNSEQNRELRATLFIEIITKCKLLFIEYIEKLHLFNNKDIFSNESNLVRIRLQLAADIRHKLHIPTLRRHIYQNISKNVHIDIPKCCEISLIEKKEENFLTKVLDKNRRSTDEINTLSPTKHLPIISVNKSSELNEQEEVRENKNKNISQRNNEYINSSSNKTINESVTCQTKSFPTKNNQDLLQLIVDDTVDDETDNFPKLSIANPPLDKHRSRYDNLNKKIEILKNQNDDREISSKYTIRPPIVEQPSTVQKLYNNQIYSVADIRPTERKSDYEITLSLFGPVWNELADEITPEIVRQLDSNLFRGEEVKDIYKQMMKTVSRDYLSYTDDAIIEDCPQKVFIQDIMASHTLYSETKRDRIINNDLKKYLDSPWKSQNKSRAEWEQPNYTIENGSTSDLDLKQYISMSINELSNAVHYGRGSYGGSLSSAINSTRDLGTSLGYFNETQTYSRATPIRNIIPKRNYIISQENFERGISRLPKLMQDRLIKQYEEWFCLWKKTYEFEDYLKYLSLQPSDFLSVIFHDYDSQGEESDENDEYLYPDLVEERNKMTVREKERESIIENKILELKMEKCNYVKGLWNPSTIFIGGLGKTPALTYNEKKKLLKDKPALPDPSDRLSKMSAYSRAQSAVSPGKPTPLFVRKKNEIPHSDTSDNQLLSSDEDVKFKAIQNRLEQIWSNLKMPNHLRLDMAIKYSSEINLKSIETVLKSWDKATNLLLEREELLSELEKFEKTASDPNRFFSKGYRGSSLARTEESKIRQDLNEKINQCSINVSNAIQELKSSCSDELSYEGRPYADKMIWDRTEMLYWLQEERKERSLNGIHDYLTIN